MSPKSQGVSARVQRFPQSKAALRFSMSVAPQCLWSRFYAVRTYNEALRFSMSVAPQCLWSRFYAVRTYNEALRFPHYRDG
jgi:hypothetical protein